MTAMGVSERNGGVISSPSRVAKKTQRPTATAAPTMVTKGALKETGTR